MMAAYTRKDAGYRAAREAGFRSRAAPKLIELDKRFRVLARGQRVVDLGCWPGGWLQVASAKVGPAGRVIGIDLEPVADLGLANVITMTGDLGDEAVQRDLVEKMGGAADVVLCDMAPKLSGVRVADRERHIALVELALGVSEVLLAKHERGGCLVIKLFSGVEGELTKALKQRFREVAKYRPETSRKGSAEIYAVARALRKPT